MPAARRRSSATDLVPVLPALVPVPDAGDVALLAVPVRPGDDGAVPAGALPAGVPAGLDLVGLLAREGAKGSAGEVTGAPVPGDGPLERVLLLGVGDAAPADLRKAGAALARKGKDAATVALDLRPLALDDEGVAALVTGLLLASYSFSVKAEPAVRALVEVRLVVDDPKALQARLDAALPAVRATAVARDLVNTPSLQKSPEWFADRARTLLSDLDVRVLDERDLAQAGLRRHPRRRPGQLAPAAARRGAVRRRRLAARRARRQGHHVRHRRPVAQAERRRCWR